MNTRGAAAPAASAAVPDTGAGRSSLGTGLLVSRFEEIVAGVALLALVLAVCWGVVTRYVTQTPAVWTGDVAILGFAWLIFVGAAAAFKYGMHMSIDMVVNLLPASVRRPLAAVTDAGVLAFLAYLVVLSVDFCMRAWGDPMPILRWPRSFLYAAVMVGAACMLLRYAGLALRRWRGQPEALLSLPQPHEEALR